MSTRYRPPSVIVASAGGLVVGLSLVGLGIAAGAAGHGGFSQAVAAMLIGYGLLLGLAAWALWQLRLLGRGPVLALSLLNVLAGPGMAESATWLWAVIALSAITAVAAALPATGRALHTLGPDVTAPDAPLPKDSQ